MDFTRLRGRLAYRVLVRLGLISYGVVHLVTAWLALHVAFGLEATASSSGALRALAQRPLGIVEVWSMAAGLLVLALWQVLEAGMGDRRRWTLRLAALGRATTYLVLGVLALGAAGGAERPVRVEDRATAQLLALDLGPAVIAAVGLGVVVAGAAQVLRGVRRRFRRDLTRAAGRPTVVFGVVGFTAKGLVLVLIGMLLMAAGIGRDPNDVGGMDVALAHLSQHNFGAELLVAIAAGLACFGLYCFVWSGRARI